MKPQISQMGTDTEALAHGRMLTRLVRPNIRVHLYYTPAASRILAQISRGDFREFFDAGAACGLESGDDLPAFGADLVAMCPADFMNDSLRAQQPEQPGDAAGLAFAFRRVGRRAVERGAQIAV